MSANEDARTQWRSVEPLTQNHDSMNPRAWQDDLRRVADYLACIGRDRYSARLGCVTDLGGVDDN